MENLVEGSLWDCFVQGHSAAIVDCGSTIDELWSLLLLDPEERLPWELTLPDIARNHRAGNDVPSTLGDLFYFQPGQHSYMARKFEIRRRADGDPQVVPPVFHQPGRDIAPAARLISLCCSFADKIVLALTPPAAKRPTYSVAVQRLKYQSNWEDYEALAGLIHHSLARWGRFGYRLDVLRQNAARPLCRKGLSDLLAFLIMTPRLGRHVERLNRALLRGDRLRAVNCGEKLYEHPHVDYRFFTALCGLRTTVRTEVFAAGEWVELPISLNSLAIFPGTMAKSMGPIEPTIHRVVHFPSSTEDEDARTANVTVLLGAA